MQLFGELDYVREANNCERFRELYGGWKNVMVPDVCPALTRKKVLVMEWVDGQKGPWPGDEGIKMVRIGLKCSVDQLVSCQDVLFVCSIHIHIQCSTFRAPSVDDNWPISRRSASRYAPQRRLHDKSLVIFPLILLILLGNLLKTTDGKLAFIDFGMMADIDEDDRYGLFGLVIGLQNKDLPLITENLLKVRPRVPFLKT